MKTYSLFFNFFLLKHFKSHMSLISALRLLTEYNSASEMNAHIQ